MTAFINVGFYDTRPLLRQRAKDGEAEFRLCRPENRLLVKREKDGGVLICATADNLSAEQKEAFILYLCAEGFASAEAGGSAWLRELGPGSEGQAVRWIVDPSWPEPDPVYTRHLQRLCWLIVGTVMAWLVLVAAVVCC